ncbi:MAG: hypothetical protein AAGA69_09075, partial [Pseudomonadota bacterium]
MTSMTIPVDPGTLRRDIVGSIKRREFARAIELCDELEALSPSEPDSHVFRARIAQRQQNFREAADHARQALKTSPERFDVRLVEAESRIYAGDIAGAIERLRDIKKKARSDAEIMRQLSALFTQLERHEDADQCAQASLALEPRSINRRYLVASTSIALGKMGEAETWLNEVISAAPEEGDIYYNRATLRKQTTEKNHIPELKRLLSSTPDDHPRITPIAYALGKELEDLGDHTAAFSAYTQGAQARRRRLAYDVSVDEA